MTGEGAGTSQSRTLWVVPARGDMRLAISPTGLEADRWLLMRGGQPGGAVDAPTLGWESYLIQGAGDPEHAPGDVAEGCHCCRAERHCCEPPPRAVGGSPEETGGVHEEPATPKEGEGNDDSNATEGG